MPTSILPRSLPSTLGAIALGLPGVVAAADAVTELPPLVVVATRTALPLDQASPAVGLVQAAEVVERQATSVADALAFVPGFHVARSGQGGGLVSLFARGTNSDHATVLFEGRRLPGGFSGFYGLSFLALDPGMGLETLRGPASFLHGADGIGGALNLVGGALGAGRGDLAGLAEVEAGSFGSVAGRGALATTAGRVGVEAGWAGAEIDNDQPNAGSRRAQGRVALRARLADGLTADLHVLGWASDLGLPDNRKAPGYPKLQDYQEDRGWLVTPGIARDAGDWTLAAHGIVAGDRVRARNTFVFGAPPTSFTAHDFYETTTLGGSLLATRRLGGAATWTSGVDVASRDLRQVDLVFGGTTVDEHDLTAAAWTQVQARVSRSVGLSGGFRVDHTEDYDTPVTGSVQAAWDVGRAWTLFAKAGTAFAAPQPFDLYGTFGNPALDAERSLSLELGAKGRWAGASLDVVVFRNRIRDLISYDPATFSTANVGRARTRGIEVAAARALGGGFTATGALSLLEADNQVDGTRLLRRPRLVGAVGLRWAADGLGLGLEARHVADREDVDGGTFARVDAEDYTVLRLLADWTVAEGWTVFGRVENLLDESHDEVDGYAALGRGLHVGVRRAW